MRDMVVDLAVKPYIPQKKFGLTYSPLNSAKFNCLSEVTLVYMYMWVRKYNSTNRKTTYYILQNICSRQIVRKVSCKITKKLYIIKAGVCLSVFGHYDVQLTSPPVLKLWDTQGYLWLPYDLTEVIKLIKETFESKIYIFFFKKILYVISSALLSFLPYYCHSFRIMVLPSELLPFHIFFSLNSSGTFPYPKGEKNGHRRPWPYMRVIIEYIKFWMQSTKKKNRNGQISHLKEALFVWAFA